MATKESSSKLIGKGLKLKGYEDGGDPGEDAKEAANGPGQIGEFVVKGLKSLGEAGDKVKNAPGSAVREGKNAVKKGRKLLGLASGGMTGGTFGSAVAAKDAGYRGNIASKTPAALATAPAMQGSGDPAATTPAESPPTQSIGTISNNLDGSGALISMGLRQSAAAKPQGGFLTSFKQGGFVGRGGPKGIGGKRVPKNGVMMAKGGAVVPPSGPMMPMQGGADVLPPSLASLPAGAGKVKGAPPRSKKTAPKRRK